MRTAGKILLLITGLILAVLAAEGAIRIAGYWPALSSGWMLETETRLADDDLISIDRRFLDEAMYTPYQVAAPTKLIVALGDSYTQGVPVTIGEAYPAALEQILQRESMDVRVLNAGLGDSGPEQQIALFVKYVLPRVRPDVVLWQFYANDSLDNATKALNTITADGALAPLDARENWMYRRQRVYERAPLPDSIKSGSFLFHLLLRRYEADRTDAVPSDADPTAWGRKKIPLNIKWMKELAKEHRFRLYLLLVAPQATYEAVDAGTAAAQEAEEYPRLLEVLQSEPDFIHVKFDRSAIGGATIFSDGDKDPNPHGMRHFNTAGYALMAKTVANGMARGELPRQQFTAVSHLTFGQSTTRRWMRTGWYPDEASGSVTYVWSEGEKSVLELPLAMGKDLRMTFQCQPLRFPGNPDQTVAVVLNGKEIAQVPLGPATSTYSVVLPKAAIIEPLNQLEFRYAYARRLSDVQPGSSDTRLLGVAWHSIGFTGIDRP
jgi:lysophospholipase L1-like esterase